MERSHFIKTLGLGLIGCRIATDVIPIKPRGGGIKKFVAHRNKTPLLIYAHGDSVTSGASTYVQYIKADTEAAYDVNTTVVNAAVSGQGFLYLYTNIESQVLSHNPDIVTICSLLNDLYNDPGVQQNAIDYINACLAHTNPNGKHPIVVAMTDNMAGSDGRDTTLSNRAHTLIMNGYNSFSGNGNVFVVDNYAVFSALGVDSAPFLVNLHVDHIHPSATGQSLIRTTMQTALLGAVNKFLNG